MAARIISLDLTVTCPLCQRAEIRITLASQLYEDATCPVCYAVVTAHIDIKAVHP